MGLGRGSDKSIHHFTGHFLIHIQLLKTQFSLSEQPGQHITLERLFLERIVKEAHVLKLPVAMASQVRHQSLCGLPTYNLFMSQLLCCFLLLLERLLGLVGLETESFFLFQSFNVLLLKFV